MRLKAALFFGVFVTAIGLAACGDAQRSDYVRYVPPTNFSSPSPAATRT